MKMFLRLFRRQAKVYKWDGDVNKCMDCGGSMRHVLMTTIGTSMIECRKCRVGRLQSEVLELGRSLKAG